MNTSGSCEMGIDFWNGKAQKCRRPSRQKSLISFQALRPNRAPWWPKKGHEAQAPSKSNKQIFLQQDCPILRSGATCSADTDDKVGSSHKKESPPHRSCEHR
jgi:hypothetical protein